jgi:hypothetical protein
MDWELGGPPAGPVADNLTQPLRPCFDQQAIPLSTDLWITLRVIENIRRDIENFWIGTSAMGDRDIENKPSGFRKSPMQRSLTIPYAYEASGRP